MTATGTAATFPRCPGSGGRSWLSGAAASRWSVATPCSTTTCSGLTGSPRPKVCFPPTASGDADHNIVRFYRAFGASFCEPSHDSLFRRHCDVAEAHPTSSSPPRRRDDPDGAVRRARADRAQLADRLERAGELYATASRELGTLAGTWSAPAVDDRQKRRSLWLASSSGRKVAPAAAVQPPDNSNRSAPRWSSIESPGLSRSYRRNRLIMRFIMRRERCAARRSGQRPGQRASGGPLSQPPAKRQKPRHSRDSPSGASRTRTGDLLGAIRATKSLE